MSCSKSLPVLPHELLLEILSWVPVKDLMRFTCVSKWWNSLIFDPTFVKLHLQRSSKDTHVLLTFGDRNNQSRYCAAPCSIHALLENPSSTIHGCHPFIHDYGLLGVCNGLACLTDSYRGDEFQEIWVRFWNPATRVMSQDSPRFRSNKVEGLLFCPGFGYDDRSDTYIVVLVLSDVRLKTTEVRVHRLGDTCWKNVLTCPVSPILRLHGVFVSGTLNWIAIPSMSSPYRWTDFLIRELVIFSYDIKNETYRCMSLPDGLNEVLPYPPELGVLKGCLCLSVHHMGTHFRFWIMREFGVEKSWTRLLNLRYEQFHIHGYSPPLPPFPQILCMNQNDDVLFLTNGRHNTFSLYNRRDNRVHIFEDFCTGRFEFLSYDYVQSLVMPY